MIIQKFKFKDTALTESKIINEKDIIQIDINHCSERIRAIVDDLNPCGLGLEAHGAQHSKEENERVELVHRI